MRRLFKGFVVFGLLLILFRSYQVQYLLHSNQVVLLEPYMKLEIDIPVFGIRIRKPFGHKYGHGSAVLIGNKGYLLTAAHMCRNSKLFHVTFKDGREYRAVFVAKDYSSDLALLKIVKTTDHFSGVSFLGSRPMVGDSVYHIGNPINLPYILTTGIISQTLPEYLVSTAPINPGSSGGALFNRQGQLIGICSALITLSPFPAWSGHSLFVKVEDIRHFLNQWKEGMI